MATSASELEDICANCGKVGADDAKLKKCNGCHLVKYCGFDCQKAHRSVHKASCRKRAAELHEEKLFAEPPERDECAVCFLRMPFEQGSFSYKPCCGKDICIGCCEADMQTKVSDAIGGARNVPNASPSEANPFANVDFNKMLEQPCPFCRAPIAIKPEEHYKQLQKRVDLGDFKAMYHLAIKLTGDWGPIAINNKKARELLLQSAEAGYPLANLSVGMFYYDGKYPDVFPKDLKKARQYFEAGAIGGDPIAHAYLGEIAVEHFNCRRGSRHYMIAASCGYKLALDNVLNGYKGGYVSKDEYASTLRAYKLASDEMTSEQRTKAERECADRTGYEDPGMFQSLDLLGQMRDLGRR